MRLRSLWFKGFNKFTELLVEGLPSAAKLIVLIGPNGSGKTSLFEVMNFYSRWQTGKAAQTEWAYHIKNIPQVVSAPNWDNLIENIDVTFYDTPEDETRWKKAFYFRTAYRHEADFSVTTIEEVGDALDDRRQPKRLVDVETRVSDNYQRIVGAAINEVFNTSDATHTVEVVRERLIGQVRRAMENVFGDLSLQGVGNPFVDGTFLFQKGASNGYQYVNLSGGEKAAFDLLLDFIVKT